MKLSISSKYLQDLILTRASDFVPQFLHFSPKNWKTFGKFCFIKFLENFPNFLYYKIEKKKKTVGYILPDFDLM
jgi:hypothetical protein